MSLGLLKRLRENVGREVSLDITNVLTTFRNLGRGLYLQEILHDLKERGSQIAKGGYFRERVDTALQILQNYNVAVRRDDGRFYLKRHAS